MGTLKLGLTGPEGAVSIATRVITGLREGAKTSVVWEEGAPVKVIKYGCTKIEADDDIRSFEKCFGNVNFVYKYEM